MARDLHDVLSHSLSVVVIQAEVADTYLDSDPDQGPRGDPPRRDHCQGRPELTHAEWSASCVTQTRSNPVPRNLGLADLPALVERVRESGVPVTLELCQGLPALSAQGTVTAYRVVQESLTNVLRHAGKSPTHVRLTPLDGHLVIDVWDAGSDVDRSPSPGGVGLLGMRERVRSCGGELTSGPAPDGGLQGPGQSYPRRITP